MNCPTYAPTSTAQTAIAPRVHGPDVPTEGLISPAALPEYADTTPAEADITAPEEQTAASKLTVARLISAVGAASPFRSSYRRRGASGPRIQPEPPSHWEVDVHMSAGTP